MFMSGGSPDGTSRRVLGNARLKVIVSVVTCLSGGLRNEDIRVPEMNVASVRACR